MGESRKQQKLVLISILGNTDPIRGEYDGPILHIVRNYRPEKVCMILTEEMAQDELAYHHNERAIHMLHPYCEVQTIQTKIKKAHSYDDFFERFLEICSQIKEANPEQRILLNISSGTPQMQTVLCMIAISDPERYLAIQVPTPEKRSNYTAPFDPKKDDVEDWFQMDMDNLEEIPSRCTVPQLLNFRRPIIQMQTLSLIENYDYSGAYQLYESSKDNFPESVGLLLLHAKKRMNLEHKEATALADRLGLREELYPVKRSNISQLIEFFDIMKIKQYHGELNDFAMRIEILAEYLGIFILENIMKIKLESITYGSRGKKNPVRRFSKEKCEKEIPGITQYLNEQFPYTGYEWNNPVNSRTIVHMIMYLSKKGAYKKYAVNISEIMKWVELVPGVRNPAAHTITAITEDMFRSYYSKSSAKLCRSMEHVLSEIFGSEAKKEGFEIYQIINDKIKESMTNAY